MAGQSLPTRFPCWCKAVYSWGGETKRDLGFIEGDLIEVLNAGDGSWWMGRLKRDRRMVGLFPSNFVELLSEDYQPWSGSRNGSSAAISRQNSAQAQAKPVPQKQKSMFRKPFTAYAAAGAPNPAAAARERLRQGATPQAAKTTKPFSSMKRDSTESRESASPAPTSRGPSNLRAVSPRPATKRPATSPANANINRHASHARTNSHQPAPVYQTHASRAVSPAPPPSRQSSHTRSYQQQPRAVSPAPPRAVSPAPPRQQYQPRAVSPAPPPQQYRAYDRGPSPSPYSRSISPAPPSRHGSYARGPSPAPPAQSQYHYQQRAVSPAPPPQQQYHRAVSPAPPPQQQYHRAVSPAPPRQYQPRAVSPAPPSQYRAYDRGPSPAPYQRAISPAPSFQDRPQSRGVSPAPSPQQYSRAASPAPSFQYRAYDRGPSPSPYQQQIESRSPSPAPPQFQNQFDDQEEDDGPPPPPPPHRIAYDPNRAVSPAPPPQDRFTTPEPPSPNPQKFTPSPLTNAMNDVMSSLQDMASPEQETPSNPWSPDAFDQVHQASARMAGLQTGNRSGSRMGDEDDDEPVQGPPDVDDYVKRMESRLRRMHQMEANNKKKDELFMGGKSTPPPVPSKNPGYQRPGPSPIKDSPGVERKQTLRHRKSVHDLGKSLGRSFTSKTNSTTTTESTNRSLMSGYSATAMSSTSAGSYYRKKFAGDRSRSAIGNRPTGTGFGFDDGRPESSFTGVTYHSSHASGSQSRPGSSDQQQQSTQPSTPGPENLDPLGGLTQPKARRSGFFRKMIDSAKTQAANARSTMETISRPASRAASRAATRAASRAGNRIDRVETSTPAGFAGGSAAHQPTPSRDGGLGTTDWVQVRRDVNRSNSLSKNERIERAERCQMMDYPALNPVDILNEAVEGDEGLDGLPIAEPVDFAACNLAHVDKGTRFINSIPMGTTSAALAQGYVCRPFRSDVQRLRAIFTWVSERITWEEDFEGEMDTRHVLQSKRGCSQEIAMVVAEMCASVGLHAEVVRGYLKTPGEPLDLESAARPNHSWNVVIVDGEWRMMDCSLAGPTNPKRAHFSMAGSQVAESWYFLARPLEVCYSHVPLLPEQQHIVPPQPHDILMALPCATPTYFKHGLQIVDFDTSMLNLDNLEMAHVYVNVPENVECVAEVEARAYSQDADGDYFESGDFVRKPALAQAEWVGGQKRYTVKALLPGDEGQGVLKIYAGPRGLMHSNKQNPHTLAMGLPITHTGSNPPYSFLTLHPTPHAQRHDLYVAQPQCSNLVLNNTFVFCVRQHPSSTTRTEPETPLTGRASPNPFARPASAMSMQSISATGSNYTNPSQASSGSNGSSSMKPAKLAIQTPSGKIIRLTRKSEHVSVLTDADGTAWETVIKIGEKGTWRGLVLADRSARWCVFAQWECA